MIRYAYRAPRDVTTVAPAWVTRTPHCSMAGMTAVDAMASIKFLTPLEHRTVGIATNITNQNRRDQLMSNPWEPAGMKDKLTNGRTSPLRCVHVRHPHCTQRRASERDPPVFGSVVLIPVGYQASPDPRKLLEWGGSGVKTLNPHSSVENHWKLTPIPLMNKQTRHSTKP